MLGDVSSLPEKCGMLADAFDNLRLFGKQKFWLVLAGSYRFEVGSFALVIEHRFEKDHKLHAGCAGRGTCDFDIATTSQ